jgi:hypothetical protein
VSTVSWGVEVTLVKLKDIQLRNLQSLVEIGVDKNTTVVFPTVVFPAPLMTTIAELGSFIAREQAAATPALPPAAGGKLASITAASGTALNGSAGPN